MATAKKIDTPEAVEPERDPTIEPRNVQVDSAGQCFRTIVARCPDGMIQDDLRDPKIWKRVQGNRQSALQKLDHVWILAHDESWHATAIVSYVTGTEARLRIMRVGDFRTEHEQLYSDGVYAVHFTGAGGYGIKRVSDGIEMSTQTWPTEGQAIQGIRDLYQKETGGAVIGS